MDMERKNLLEQLAGLKFEQERFDKMIDPEGSLDGESRRLYWQSFESAQQNLISFYRSLEGETSEVDYIKRSINSYLDQQFAEGPERTDAKREAPGSSDKIRPIDDLDGSASWGFNDDVKGK